MRAMGARWLGKLSERRVRKVNETAQKKRSLEARLNKPKMTDAELFRWSRAELSAKAAEAKAARVEKRHTSGWIGKTIRAIGRKSGK